MKVKKEQLSLLEQQAQQGTIERSAATAVLFGIRRVLDAQHVELM